MTKNKISVIDAIGAVFNGKLLVPALLIKFNRFCMNIEFVG